MSDEFSYDDVRALFDALRAKRAHDSRTNGGGPWEPPTPLVDWVQAYGIDEDPGRWLAQPLLPAEGAVAVFAKGGTGKSLLALWIAAGLATGTGLLGAITPIDVLYLDYEMTVRDVVARLENMGYDDPTVLKGLHYASLPTLAPLDSLEGGRSVVEMAGHLGASLVVIDTFGRAVDGEEDRADTVRAWYRWTGQVLKAAGIGFLRIDHAGKDMKRGQRGTSAKNDDVDVVWEMTERRPGEFLLRATKRRVSWVPEHVRLAQIDDNGTLAYRWVDGVVGWVAGTHEVVRLLDDLDAPVDISRRKAMALLRSGGQGRGTDVVADALRFRRERLESGPQDHFRPGSPDEPQDQSQIDANPHVGPPEDQSGPPGDPNRPVGGSYYVGPPGEGGAGAADPGVIG